MRNSLLLIAFVILTNPLLAQKAVYTFDRSSVQTVTFDPKDCKHFDATGVGCTQAYLIFKRMHLDSSPVPDEENVEFYDEKGEWTMTLRYHPKLCTPERGAFLCKGVSWRTAK